MKKLIVILGLITAGNAAAQKPMKVTIDYILRDGDSSEVIVKRRAMYNNPGYIYYSAKFGVLPDSLRIGVVLNLYPDKGDCLLPTFKQLFWRKRK